MPSNPRPPVEQDPSMKAHKAQLFEFDQPAAPSGSSTPFHQFLRETPADPLPLGVKAALWAAGVIVVLLLVLAILRITHPRPTTTPAADLGRPAPMTLLDC